mgnify:FL=1
MLPVGDDNSQRRRFPFVTYGLVIVNVLAFLLELAGGEAFINTWSFIPGDFLVYPVFGVITIFTSMFLHAGWMHLGGNMLYLLIFGDNVEDRFGHFKFLLFYLLSGVAAILAQYMVSMNSRIPTLGASGAIAGVLAAYLLLYPGRRVRVLVITWIVNMPALIVIGGWILIQLISGIGSISDTRAGGVAYMAHIGGFVAGLILTMFMRSKARPNYY